MSTPLSDNEVTPAECPPPVKRTDGHIKRPMNAFMVWSQIQRAKIVKEKPSMHNAVISKQLGIAWKQLSPEERLPFMIESERLKRVHQLKYPDYKYRPKKRTKSEKEADTLLLQRKAEIRRQHAARSSTSRSPVISRATPSTSTTSTESVRSSSPSPRSSSADSRSSSSSNTGGSCVTVIPAVKNSAAPSTTAVPLSLGLQSTTMSYKTPNKRHKKMTRHIISPVLSGSQSTTTSSRPVYSLPLIKRKRAIIKTEKSSDLVTDRFEFCEAPIPRKVVKRTSIQNGDTFRGKRLKFSDTATSTATSTATTCVVFRRHFPPPSPPGSTRRPGFASPPPLSAQKRFQACSPILPHESQIISELAPPPATVRQTDPDMSSPGKGCHSNTTPLEIYFDNYVDFFKGCLNETEVSLSNYTTDEVWNLIKLESPFEDTSVNNSGGNLWTGSGGSTACC